LATYSTKQEWAILAKAVFMLFFLPPSRFWIPASMPFLHLGETVYQPLTTIKKMSGVQAGLLGEWYGKLAFFKKVRKSKAELWRRDVPVGVTAPDTLRRIDWGALLRYPVFIDNPRKRNGILAFSRKTGLGLAPGYPAPISSLSILDSSEKMRRLPGASACAEKLITLPNHQFVTRDAVNLTCALIAQTDSTSPGVDPQSI
ncbi:MAG: DegT/DnrJ/EryC1/StrS family aminotransferase, partial [Chitinivibrionales bacterium]